MSKQPFLPLFFGDFLASTAEWTGEEASLYLTLLGHQWTLGTLPADPAKLARLVRWERKTFDKCWPQVAAKFEEKGGRLVNDRLEQHRAKADEIAHKNKAAGRKGAEARWGKDSERHGEAIASAMADAKEPLCHPIQTIPNQTSLQPSSPVTNLTSSARGVDAGRAERKEIPRDVPRETLAAIRNRYPPGLYRDSDWLLAERAIRSRIGEGASPDQLITAARDYGEQQVALEKAGTQFVLRPSAFFGETGEWRGPFPLPAKPENAFDRFIRANGGNPNDTSRTIDHEPDSPGTSLRALA